MKSFPPAGRSSRPEAAKNASKTRSWTCGGDTPARSARISVSTTSEARRIFAGSDFLLMPSRFEPCGLSQMYAQKSGSLPIAHRTGGLVDTIEDGVTGFLFNASSRDALSQRGAARHGGVRLARPHQRDAAAGDVAGLRLGAPGRPVWRALSIAR